MSRRRCGSSLPLVCRWLACVQVNLAFETLKQRACVHQSTPPGGAGARLAKVEILRHAIDYIESMERLLRCSSAAVHHVQTSSPQLITAGWTTDADVALLSHDVQRDVDYLVRSFILPSVH